MKVMQLTAVSAVALLAATAAHADFGDTLRTVQARGALSCTGHNGSYPGMAEVDDQGNWRASTSTCAAPSRPPSSAPPRGI